MSFQKQDDHLSAPGTAQGRKAPYKTPFLVEIGTANDKTAAITGGTLNDGATNAAISGS